MNCPVAIARCCTSVVVKSALIVLRILPSFLMKRYFVSSSFWMLSCCASSDVISSSLQWVSVSFKIIDEVWYLPFDLSTLVLTPTDDGFQLFAELFSATSAVSNSRWIFPWLFLKAWSKFCLGKHPANSLLIFMLFSKILRYVLSTRRLSTRRIWSFVVLLFWRIGLLFRMFRLANAVKMPTSLVSFARFWMAPEFELGSCLLRRTFVSSHPLSNWTYYRHLKLRLCSAWCFWTIPREQRTWQT